MEETAYFLQLESAIFGVLEERQAIEDILGVSALSAKGDVIVCRSIRFKDGKQTDATLCRVSGYIPPAAPGRKSKAQL